MGFANMGETFLFELTINLPAIDESQAKNIHVDIFTNDPDDHCPSAEAIGNYSRLANIGD